MTRKRIHGHSFVNKRPTQEYMAWNSMKQRCYNVRTKCFKNYGARGIIVCDEWRCDFTAFLRDMGPRPSPRHSLERVNNDGNYEPSNCTWATWQTQIRNMRATKLSVVDVAWIRMWLRRGFGGSRIARAFGVSAVSVSNIKTGRRWADVT